MRSQSGEQRFSSTALNAPHNSLDTRSYPFRGKGGQMRLSLLVLVAVSVCAMPALADAPGGTIAVFADPLGENCYPQDIAPGLFQVYVVHINDNAMTGSEFRVLAGEGFTGVYLGEYPGSTGFVTVGYAFEGIAMGYGRCFPTPIHLLTMSFYVQGSSRSCCYFRVVADPRTGGLSGVTCDFEAVPAEGGTTYVNPDGTCACRIPGHPTPVEPSTWGQVKAMYAAD